MRIMCKIDREIDAKVRVGVDVDADVDFCNYFILEKNVNLYMENNIIGSMKLYQLPHYDDGDQQQWADTKCRYMIDLVEVKERLCDYDSEEFDEDSPYSTHHILDEFYIRPQYRGKGYSYKALAEGLKQAGCEESFIYLYPSTIHFEKEERFMKHERKKKAPILNKTQLRKFYKNMSPTVTTHKVEQFIANKGRHKGKMLNETYLTVRNWTYGTSKGV